MHGVNPVVEPLGHDELRAALRERARRLALGNDDGLHHAWIFSGPAGVGKFLCARWWASLLKCSALGHCDPACENCRLVAAGVHPDVFEVAPAADRKSIGIADSRSLLQRLALKATRRGPRVAIVREAGTMTVEAQNALLKLLEEPKGSAVIVLVTDNAGAMLATVRSRCRHAAFGALAADDVTRILVSLGRSETEARAAAACSRGSVARALAFDAEGREERERIVEAFEKAREGREELEAAVALLLTRKESGYALGDLLEWQLAKIEAALGRRPDEPSTPLAEKLAGLAGRDPKPLLEDAERVHRTMALLNRNANARLVIRDLLLNVRG